MVHAAKLQYKIGKSQENRQKSLQNTLKITKNNSSYNDLLLFYHKTLDKRPKILYLCKVFRHPFFKQQGQLNNNMNNIIIRHPHSSFQKRGLRRLTLIFYN
jgi:hypothetical protein